MRLKMDIQFASFKQDAEKYIKLFDGREKSSDRLPYIVCDNNKEVEECKTLFREKGWDLESVWILKPVKVAPHEWAFLRTKFKNKI